MELNGAESSLVLNNHLSTLNLRTELIMNCVLTDYETGITTPVQCNTVNGSVNLFTGQVTYQNYGYEPNHAAAYAFIALYALGFVAHLVLGIWRKCWWTLPTLAAGAALETVGWGGRLWSIKTWAWDINEGGIWTAEFGGFITQIVCLVIAPTFFSAANYVLLGRLITNTGPSYVSLHPQSFSVFFICADFVCLLVQAGGGGIAGTASDQEGSNNGGYIMTGGVILQLVVTAIFILVLCEWIYRRDHGLPAKRQYNPFAWTKHFSRRSRKQSSIVETRTSHTSAHNPYETINTFRMDSFSNEGYPKSGSRLIPNVESVQEPQTVRGHGHGNGARTQYQISEKKVKLMLALISIGTLLIVIRSVYRSIELLKGWSGPVATNEPLFIGMDALLMFLFVYLYAFLHPSLAFGGR
ncbi:hypothetical protein CI109_106332 [Kwoniella shandongensis]|uniref:RTA1-domain-containing protein n=1 Tax=Kwoniella shandongensis TaxID=1734106 RepID=A0AAJ8LQ24_9TREE